MLHVYITRDPPMKCMRTSAACSTRIPLCLWLTVSSARCCFRQAFTTGKSLGQGGIPHDMYGMTTHSVRAYVMGIQEKLGLNGASCSKVGRVGFPYTPTHKHSVYCARDQTSQLRLMFSWPVGLAPHHRLGL